MERHATFLDQDAPHSTDNDSNDEHGEDSPHGSGGDRNSRSSTPDGGGRGASGLKTSANLQKRRRVTRACDECRRKKIKCDGKQPCTHCTVYSYECTYDQPSNRRRNPAPQYVESLEHRVHRAETLLHILIPNLDLSDPGIDAAVAQGWIPGAPGKGVPPRTGRVLNMAPTSMPSSMSHRPINDTANTAKSDTDLESMVRAVAQLDMDEDGHWDYHGHSSGLSFVRRMREQLGDLMGPEMPSTPFVKSRPKSQVFDSPRSFTDSPGTDHFAGVFDLPPIDVARQTCQHAVSDATALLRVVHQPSFWNSFESLYSTPQEQYTNEHSRFLPLFHSVMAVGRLFGRDENPVQQGYEDAIQQGFAHFKAARQLMDIADCRDLSSIQAVLFMILFLQSSAKLSQCYAYVGVAMRSAVRMGLHRAHAGNFDPVEAEVRKRVFWIVRKMDVYIGAMLGLPHTLSDEDIDQDFPSEIDDEYITLDGVLPQPEGHVSLMAAFNAHTRLVQLLSKIVRLIYPIKSQGQQSRQDKTYSVPFSAVREIESDLEAWKNDLPSVLSPCAAPSQYTRVQQLLRLSYAHAQVMLYRPFLHFTAMEKRTKPIDQRAYACGASFVNVSRNLIHITSHMKQKGLLNAAHWFIMYTTFFSILALVYFAAENPDNATTQAVMRDALEGKQVLASLATRSMAADRCTATLDVIFGRLPLWMREGQQNPVLSRKRQFEDHTSTSFPTSSDTPAVRSHPDVSKTDDDRSDFALPKRANTFPRPAQLTVSESPDSRWSQSGTSSSYGPHTPTSTMLDQNPAISFKRNDNVVSDKSTYIPHSIPTHHDPSALPDLSAMMFPAADEPFIYPNQPLTTFENNQQLDINDGDFTSAQQRFQTLNGAQQHIHNSHRQSDNLEAQFYPLPPYINHQQQIQSQPQIPAVNFAHSAPNYLSPLPTNGAMPLPVGGAQWRHPGQSTDMNAIDIGDIFGGNEWNSMLMNTGYQG